MKPCAVDMYSTASFLVQENMTIATGDPSVSMLAKGFKVTFTLMIFNRLLCVNICVNRVRWHSATATTSNFGTGTFFPPFA